MVLDVCIYAYVYWATAIQAFGHTRVLAAHVEDTLTDTV